jgi:hypothetical protein
MLDGAGALSVTGSRAEFVGAEVVGAEFVEPDFLIWPGALDLPVLVGTTGALALMKGGAPRPGHAEPPIEPPPPPPADGANDS